MIEIKAEEIKSHAMFSFATAIKNNFMDTVAKQSFKTEKARHEAEAKMKITQISLPSQNRDKMLNLFQRATTDDTETIQIKADEFI